MCAAEGLLSLHDPLTQVHMHQENLFYKIMWKLWKAVWDIRKSSFFPIVTVLYNKNVIFILISHILSVFPVETKY